MEIKFKVLALVAITVIGLAMPLGAQESNQYNATAGVFGTDVDNYMSVNYYDEVNFNKWFGYLGGDTSGVINLGYATKFNGIYLGGFYTGNVFGSITNKTTRLTTTWDTSLQQLLTKTDEKEYDQLSNYTYTYNNIEALVGLTGLNMGIKVGFLEAVLTYNSPYNTIRDNTSTTTQNPDGSVTHTGNDSISYEDSMGNMIPFLQWGMKLKAGSYLITPRAGAGVNFSENKLIDKYYTSGRTTYQGTIVGQERIERYGHNYGYIGLIFEAGADFYLNDSMYVGLDYGLGMNIYNQSFGAAGRSGSVKGTISWENGNNYSTIDKFIDRTVKYDSVQIDVTEQSNMSHQILPAFWKEWNVFGENLKLGVLVQLPIKITSESSSNYTDAWTTSETTYNDANFSQNNTTTITQTHTAGNKVETSILEIAPTVGVGVSYELIPKKFTVNAGINVNVPSFYSESTVTSMNGVDSTYTKTEIGSGSGKYTSNESSTVTAPNPVTDSVHTETSWSGLSGSIAGGFVFSFNDNFALDLLLASTGGFDVNVANLNVLFSIKF